MRERDTGPGKDAFVHGGAQERSSLEQPAANRVLLNGTEFRTLRLHRRTVVTWRRDGRTCVVSAAIVPASVLQTLAAWRAPGLPAGD